MTNVLRHSSRFSTSFSFANIYKVKKKLELILLLSDLFILITSRRILKISRYIFIVRMLYKIYFLFFNIN